MNSVMRHGVLVGLSIALIVTRSAVAQTAICKPANLTSATCGVAGHGKPGTYYDAGYASVEPQHVASIEDCARLCARRQPLRFSHGCSGFGFKSDTGLCQLGQLPINGGVETDPKSATIYYDYGCFECGKVCPQPYGTQLLDNGNFEMDLFGPWEAFDANIKPGHNSDNSFHYPVIMPGIDDVNDRLHQDFNTCKGDLYRVRFDYRTDTHRNCSAATTLYFSTENGQYRIETSPGKFRDWSTNTFMFESQKRLGSVTAKFSKYNCRDHYIDNVHVSRVPRGTTSGQPSLIVNGGVESGHLKPWVAESNKNHSISVVSPGIGSKYGILWDSAKTKAGSFERVSPILSQTLETKPNTTYLFSFDALSKGKKNIDISAAVFFNSGGDEVVYGTNLPDGAKHYSTYYFATKRHTTLKLSFVIESEYIKRLLLDNFKMKEVI